jgi:dihydroorotase
VLRNGADLSAALAKITSAPATILGLSSGRIRPGAPADLCLFDPAAHWRVTRDSLRSQGKNTPYLGYEVRGRVRYTMVAGKWVYQA